MSEERFVAIETKLDALADGQNGLADGQKALARDLRGEIADLGHQMRVLHEDTIANIKALALARGRRRE